MRKYVVRLSLSDQNGDQDAAMFALTRVINDASHTMAVMGQSICAAPCSDDAENDRQLVISAAFNLDGSDMVVSLPNSFTDQFDKSVSGWDVMLRGRASFVARAQTNLFHYYRDADLRETYVQLRRSVPKLWWRYAYELPYDCIWRMAAKRIKEGRIPADVCLTHAIFVNSIRHLCPGGGRLIKAQVIRWYDQERRWL